MKQNKISLWSPMMKNDLIYGKEPATHAAKALLKIIEQKLKNKLSELAHSKK